MGMFPGHERQSTAFRQKDFLFARCRWPHRLRIRLRRGFGASMPEAMKGWMDGGD
jgi:hypothetical protein